MYLYDERDEPTPPRPSDGFVEIGGGEGRPDYIPGPVSEGWISGAMVEGILEFRKPILEGSMEILF